MSEIAWSPGQEEALATITAWLRIRYAPFFYLAGYAGTGKTTLAREIAKQVNGKVRYAAFTGKAAKVMRQAGCLGAQTIHSLIYKTDIDLKTGNAIYQIDPHALEDVSLVIVDEVSMVDEELGRDLLWFGVPILVLGDPAQLPPVRGTGFFTAGKPTVMLTEIHRQAKDSPIIRLATEIREGNFRRQETREDGLTVCKKADLDPKAVTDADAVIVGLNRTRTSYNKRLREMQGFTDPLPQKGEALICLRNDREKQIVNGEIFTVSQFLKTSTRKGGKLVWLKVAEPENEARPAVEVQVYEHFFRGRADELDWKVKRDTQEFDYAYAITAHKAQGSQFPRVCVFDESFAFREDAHRWLYTAVTRASQQLTMVI